LIIDILSGMIAMEKTLVGINLLDPRVLLEEGIRKQLVLAIAKILHETLVFPSQRVEEFESRLTQLTQILDGFRRSFQCILSLAQELEPCSF
jgi:hypothetical protein